VLIKITHPLQILTPNRDMFDVHLISLLSYQ